MTKITTLLATLALAAPAAAGRDPVRIPDLDTSRSSNGIVNLPSDTAQPILRVFQRGTVVRTAHGDPIHILAQRGVSPLVTQQVRSALKEVLAPVRGSAWGEDKRAVAQALADQPAVLMIFRSQASVPEWRPGTLAGTKLSGMALLADTVYLEGDPRTDVPGNPDEALAAAVRLVYEFGIPEALPAFAERMERATADAIERGVLDAAAFDGYTLRQIAAVHLATALEVSYGMWQGAGRPARGFYAPTTRAELTSLDPVVADLVHAFFLPYRQGERLVWPGFGDAYSLDPKAQPAHAPRRSLIANLTLVGGQDAALEGNGLDNRLVGNAGDNDFRGLAGDDVILGGQGLDTASYRGFVDQYHVEIEGDLVYVIDLAPGRDGSDVLRDIEILRFRDAEIPTDPTR